MALEGQAVAMLPNQEREAYFMLRDSSRVTGFGGCNMLNGSYELNEGQLRLRFTNGLSTMRACPGRDKERGFLDVLNQADNYTLRADTLRAERGPPCSAGGISRRVFLRMVLSGW